MEREWSANRVLPRHLANAALLAVNTGCLDQEVCQLRSEWEAPGPDRNTSVFTLPDAMTKTGTDWILVLNSVARRLVQARRGTHP